MRARREQPVILEKLIQISLADLRKLGFLDKVEGYKSCPVTIKWNSGLAIESCTIWITVSTQSGNSYVLFEFNVRGKKVESKVLLTQRLNHLTGLHRFYFICGQASKICRRLYIYQNKFVCRDAIPNRYYLQNVMSKGKRIHYESAKRIQKLEKTIAQRGNKYFTVYRNGQHTVRMKKVALAKAKLDLLLGHQ